jgi:hypothetical protein
MVSSFICSIDCTTAAKFSMVFRSDKSRDCATVDIVRCSSISHAISSVSAALNPKRGHSRRATLAPAME